MPFHTDYALSLLYAHTVHNSDARIHTRKVDADKVLTKAEHRFNGMKVTDILKPDCWTTFEQTRESRAIVELMAKYLDLIHDDSTNHKQCDGIITADDINNVIDEALFKLEKAYVQEAKPQVAKPKESK